MSLAMRCSEAAQYLPKSFPLGVADARDVVDQRVEPDVGDVLLVPGDLDAPGQARLGPRDAEVLQGLLQEGEHFVSVALGPDEVGVVVDVADEPLLVLAHLEEVVALLAELGLRLVVGALAVDELRLRVEALAAHAVVAAVLAEVDVARVVDLLEDVLDGLDVVFVGGADEVVVGDGKLGPEVAELGADPVGEGLGRLVVLPGRLGDLVAVLVGARHEEDVVARHAVEAGHDVAHDRRVGMPDVGRGVDVVDGCRDVKDLLGVHGASLYPVPDCHVRISAGCAPGEAGRQIEAGAVSAFPGPRFSALWAAALRLPGPARAGAP